MVVFLILLYVLEANGAVIPIGCFIASWTIFVLKGVYSFIKFAMECEKKE